MPSPELGPRGGKYPHHVVQSILVPKDRNDVRGDPGRARVVAERYGARPGGKIAEQENYFAFRQVNPDKIQDGTYVSFKVPFSGVVLRKGLPVSARKNPTRWWSKAPKHVQEVYDSIAAHRDINAQFAAARKFSHEQLLEAARWNDRDGDYHLNDHESLAGYVVNSVRGTSSFGPIEYPPGHEYGARGNPPEEPGIGTFLAIGAVVAVGLGILASRAQAATAPDPNRPVSPVPTTPPPPTVRRPTAPAPTFVRQEDGFDPGSTAATRVLQTQLRSLGYHVPSIDGIFGRDTTLAVTAFLDANGLSFETTTARDIFQMIDSQYAYFFDTRGGLRSI